MKILGINKKDEGSMSRPKSFKNIFLPFPSFTMKKDIQLKKRIQPEVTGTLSVTNLTNVFKHILKVQR